MALDLDLEDEPANAPPPRSFYFAIGLVALAIIGAASLSVYRHHLEVEPVSLAAAPISQGEHRRGPALRTRERAAASSPAQGPAPVEPQPPATAEPAPPPLPPEAAATVANRAGDARSRRGLFRQAATEYEAAVAADPRADGAMGALALCYVNMNRGDDALAMATRASEVNPDNAQAWLVRGYVLSTKHRRDEARSAYRRCVEVGGTSPSVRECRHMVR